MLILETPSFSYPSHPPPTSASSKVAACAVLALVPTVQRQVPDDNTEGVGLSPTLARERGVTNKARGKLNNR